MEDERKRRMKKSRGAAWGGGQIGRRAERPLSRPITKLPSAEQLARGEPHAGLPSAWLAGYRQLMLAPDQTAAQPR